MNRVARVGTLARSNDLRTRTVELASAGASAPFDPARRPVPPRVPPARAQIHFAFHSSGPTTSPSRCQILAAVPDAATSGQPKTDKATAHRVLVRIIRLPSLARLATGFRSGRTP